MFLSRHALAIFIALKTFVGGSETFAGGSEYVLPSRYDSDVPMHTATLNRVMTLTYQAAQKKGEPLSKFGPHDLRRTVSTLLPEADEIKADIEALESWVATIRKRRN